MNVLTSRGRRGESIVKECEERTCLPLSVVCPVIWRTLKFDTLTLDPTTRLKRETFDSMLVVMTVQGT